MKVNSIQSNAIEWLRFFCASAVVMIHARGGVEDLSYHNGTYDFLRIFFSEGFCRVAVPIFFILSGYLFFVNLNEWNNRIWIKKLKKRIRTLLVPYFLWNFISVFFSLGILFFHYLVKGGAAPSIVDFYHSVGGLRVFVDSRNGLFPYDLPLWFIRDLMIYVIVSPIIYYFIKHTRIIGLSVLFLAFILGIDDSCFWGNFFQGIFYFSLGAFFSIFSCNFFKHFEQYLILTSCFAVPLLFVIVFTYGNNDILCGYAVRLFTLGGSFSVIGIIYTLTKKKKVKIKSYLSNSSFLIYAAHYIILPIVWNFFHAVMPNNQCGLIVGYFATSLSLVALLVLCYIIMSKLSPKTLAVLVGGRIG